LIVDKVLDYFFTILHSENRPGDCPAMRGFIANFYSIGLKVEDVYLICSAFKNVLSKLCSQANPVAEIEYSNLIMVLDYNLYSVLSLYSEMIRSHEEQIEIRNTIIQENVLYTRTDKAGVIIEVTDAFCTLSGYSREELIGKTHSLFRHPSVDSYVYKELWKTIKGGGIWSGNLPNLHKDGSTFVTMARIVPHFDRQGKIVEYMAFRTDITSDELLKIDPLSGLYNRREFDRRFQELYANAVAKNDPFSVILADIDHFKRVNDTYGHQKGDELIRSFSDILRTCTRYSDICARWGGEEFIILLPQTTVSIAYEVAERIRQALVEDIRIGSQPLSCSLGVAEHRSGEKIDELFKRVDDYLYRAKENGRNCSVMNCA
jgi:diguanylate cyclase (GGDEF)-like protein/PAS domain S-box-containing protein